MAIHTPSVKSGSYGVSVVSSTVDIPPADTGPWTTTSTSVLVNSVTLLPSAGGGFCGSGSLHVLLLMYLVPLHTYYVLYCFTLDAASGNRGYQVGTAALLVCGTVLVVPQTTPKCGTVVSQQLFLDLLGQVWVWSVETHRGGSWVVWRNHTLGKAISL